MRTCLSVCAISRFCCDKCRIVTKPKSYVWAQYSFIYYYFFFWCFLSKFCRSNNLYRCLRWFKRKKKNKKNRVCNYLSHATEVLRLNHVVCFHSAWNKSLYLLVPTCREKQLIHLIRLCWGYNEAVVWRIVTPWYWYCLVVNVINVWTNRRLI